MSDYGGTDREPVDEDILMTGVSSKKLKKSVHKLHMSSDWQAGETEASCWAWCWKHLDNLGACAIMCFSISREIAGRNNPGHVSVRDDAFVFAQGFWHNHPSPLALDELTQCCSIAVNYALMILLWHTFCFRRDVVHRIWRWMLPGRSIYIMAGGFIPRASALSIGLMLFLSSAVLKETYIYPAKFGKRHKLLQGDLDLPAEVAFTGMQSHWTRLQECKGIGVQLSDGYTRVFSDEAVDGCFLQGQHFNETVEETARARGVDLGYHTVHRDQKCLYMCFVWQNFGVDSLVRNMGVIASGAVFIVALSDAISSHIGWRFVRTNSTPQELEALFWRTGTGTLQGSAFLCALQIGSLMGIRKFFATMTDDNGPSSPSFCVALVLFQSLFCTVMLRFWSPLTCRPIFYTQKLWQNGKDTFMEFDPDGSSRRVVKDLYEWLHLTNKQRCEYLFYYAKQVDGTVKRGDEVILLESKRIKTYKEREIELVDGPIVLLEAIPLTIPAETIGIVQEVVGNKIRTKWQLDHDEADAHQFPVTWSDHQSRSVMRRCEEQSDDWRAGVWVLDRLGERMKVDDLSEVRKEQFPLVIKVWKVVTEDISLRYVMQAGDEWDNFEKDVLVSYEGRQRRGDSRGTVKRASLSDPLLIKGPGP